MTDPSRREAVVVPLVPRALRLGAVAVVAVGLAYTSLLSNPAGAAVRGPLGLVGADKWLHAVAYAALAATVAYAVADRPPLVAAGLALSVAVGYGLAIEIAQVGLPRRRFDLADLAANAVGAALVTGVWAAVARHVRFRRLRT